MVVVVGTIARMRRMGFVGGRGANSTRRGSRNGGFAMLLLRMKKRAAARRGFNHQGAQSDADFNVLAALVLLLRPGRCGRG